MSRISGQGKLARATISLDALPINLLVAGTTVFAPIRPPTATAKFITRSVIIRIKTLTGSVSTTPRLRIGTVSPFTNICALTTLTAIAADNCYIMLEASTLVAVDIQTAGITLEVERAAVGPSALTIEVYIEGVSVA